MTFRILLGWSIALRPEPCFRALCRCERIVTSSPHTVRRNATSFPQAIGKCIPQLAVEPSWRPPKFKTSEKLEAIDAGAEEALEGLLGKKEKAKGLYDKAYG